MCCVRAATNWSCTRGTCLWQFCQHFISFLPACKQDASNTYTRTVKLSRNSPTCDGSARNNQLCQPGSHWDKGKGQLDGVEDIQPLVQHVQLRAFAIPANPLFASKFGLVHHPPMLGVVFWLWHLWSCKPSVDFLEKIAPRSSAPSNSLACLNPSQKTLCLGFRV